MVELRRGGDRDDRRRSCSIRSGSPIVDVEIEVDETSPLGRAHVVVARPGGDRGRERRARRPEAAPAALATAGTADVLGRALLRVRDRRTPGFGDAPADDDLTLPQSVAWDVYSIGRLERLGYHVAAPAPALPLPQPPRLHRRRRRRLRAAVDRDRRSRGPRSSRSPTARSRTSPSADRGDMTTEIRHRQVATNGIELHVAEAGDGPLVVLCHGFPESWYSWRHQIVPIAEAGYHVIAPRPARLRRLDQAHERRRLRHREAQPRSPRPARRRRRGASGVRRPRLGRADRVGPRTAASRACARASSA